MFWQKFIDGWKYEVYASALCDVFSFTFFGEEEGLLNTSKFSTVVLKNIPSRKNNAFLPHVPPSVNDIQLRFIRDAMSP